MRDKLLDVDKAIKGRLLEWETLIEQAVTNTKEQFYNSPDLDERTLAALMDALLPFTALSRHALEPNASAPRSSPSCAGRGDCESCCARPGPKVVTESRAHGGSVPCGGAHGELRDRLTGQDQPCSIEAFCIDVAARVLRVLSSRRTSMTRGQCLPAGNSSADSPFSPTACEVGGDQSFGKSSRRFSRVHPDPARCNPRRYAKRGLSAPVDHPSSLRLAARPRKPRPRRASVPGSGTLPNWSSA